MAAYHVVFIFICNLFLKFQKNSHSIFSPIADHSREFSGGLGNVAWKERVDGWRMKQDKNSIHGHTVTNGTSLAPSEGRGVGDIDATTEYNMDEDLLLVSLKFSSLLCFSVHKFCKLNPRFLVVIYFVNGLGGQGRSSQSNEDSDCDISLL